MDWDRLIHEVIEAVVFGAVGFLMLGVGIYMMEKLTPFSIRKEIEEDHNVALGVILAGVLIAMGIMIASVVR